MTCCRPYLQCLVYLQRRPLSFSLHRPTPCRIASNDDMYSPSLQLLRCQPPDLVLYNASTLSLGADDMAGPVPTLDPCLEVHSSLAVQDRSLRVQGGQLDLRRNSTAFTFVHISDCTVLKKHLSGCRSDVCAHLRLHCPEKAPFRVQVGQLVLGVLKPAQGHAVLLLQQRHNGGHVLQVPAVHHSLARVAV